MTTKRPMKESGLIGAPGTAKHHVPPNVSGRDVSAAVKRMPSFDEDDAEGADSSANTPASASPTPAPVSMSAEVHALRGRLAERDIRKVPVSKLVDSPYQPRLQYRNIDELADSLKVRQLEPIVVRPLPDGTFQLISGHRRTRAAQLVGIEELDARVFEVSDAEAQALALSFNESREDLSDFERARGYKAAVGIGKAYKTNRELAHSLGISTGLVSQRLSMLTLHAVVLGVLEEYPDAFSSRAVEPLRQITSKTFDEEKLREALIRVAKKQISVPALMSIMASSATPQRSGSEARSPVVLKLHGKVFASVKPHPFRNDKFSFEVPGIPENVDPKHVAERVAEFLLQQFGTSDAQ